jgi:hypothetical protein
MVQCRKFDTIHERRASPKFKLRSEMPDHVCEEIPPRWRATAATVVSRLVRPVTVERHLRESFAAACVTGPSCPAAHPAATPPSIHRCTPPREGAYRVARVDTPAARLNPDRRHAESVWRRRRDGRPTVAPCRPGGRRWSTLHGKLQFYARFEVGTGLAT